MTAEHRRSDFVRERRNQRRGPSQVNKSRRNSARREMPPMVSRSGMVVSPAVELKRRNKKQLRNRRRFDVAIGSTGAEIRFPAVAVPRVGWRVLSLLILAGLGFAFYWLWTAPQFSVTTDRVVVKGINRIEEEMLLDKAGILNQPVFLVDPDDLTENLPGKIPALESIDISVGLSGKVVIEAVERIPVIAWDQESISSISWVDVNGMIFPSLGTSEGLVNVKANAAPPTPPVQVSEQGLETAGQDLADAEDPGNAENSVNVNTPVQLLEPALVDGILNLSKGLPEGSQLVYDGEHGFGWQDPDFGWMVYFGKELDQTNLRLKIYTEIVNMFENKERKPILISVEYMHAPYYRMEP